jgi:hypothetical protein
MTALAASRTQTVCAGLGECMGVGIRCATASKEFSAGESAGIARGAHPKFEPVCARTKTGRAQIPRKVFSSHGDKRWLDRAI